MATSGYIHSIGLLAMLELDVAFHCPLFTDRHQKGYLSFSGNNFGYQ